MDEASIDEALNLVRNPPVLVYIYVFVNYTSLQLRKCSPKGQLKTPTVRKDQILKRGGYQNNIHGKQTNFMIQVAECEQALTLFIPGVGGCVFYLPKVNCLELQNETSRNLQTW